MKKAVIFGAGNIGRGFIGQLFRESGYEISFIEVDRDLVKRLNHKNHYSIKLVTNEKEKKINIDQVKALHPDNISKISEEIAKAEVMATAVGVNALPYIIEPLVSGLKKRWENNNISALNIIICENLIDADKYIKNLIIDKLTEKENRLFNKSVGLVKASIGRMVPEITDEMKQKNPLQIVVEPYNKLPVDKKGFKGEIPEIKNMIPFSPFSFHIQRKLYMHNMAHASTAYLGYQNNFTYIWEAIQNSTVKLLVKGALQEAARALAQKHEVKLEELLLFGDSLITRFNNRALGDTVKRVGRDPVRKLNKKDRLLGPTNLCIQQEIKPVYLSIGIAAAFLFDPEEDDSAPELQKKLNKKSFKEVLSEISKVDPDSNLYNYIKTFYNMFRNGCEITDVLNKAEKMK
ncbi:MAG: mannitol dehydrogenase [Bacillota bacterium]